ncbi:non-ribosomal peptide synthetase [uncultured Dokdonia sp.]|uniref:non-ribosomal peptide synthetase n=1 Tax=uncultured Dokdonia sp. TaxID=575653 RepID=UPI002618E771|nr:non-ribosomal peptide synthetase [uncultured Dokdonia sp.]
MIEHLIHTLQSLKIGLKVIDGSLKINAPKGALTTEVVNKIKAHKSELITLLSFTESIPKAEEKGYYALTSSQKRLWTLSQFETGNTAYNIFDAFEYKGEIDIDALSLAYTKLIERHESLRTIFKEDNQGALGQYIVPVKEYTGVLQFVDLSNETDKVFGDYFDVIQGHVFDLEKGPLFIGEVVKVTNEKYILMFNMHHIIGDGWSMEVLNKEFMILYNGFSTGQEMELPELPIQYKDYSEWQNSDARLAILEKSKTFWLETFTGELPVLELPSSKMRPKLKTYNGSGIDYSFSKEFTSQLNGYAQQNGVTLFMVLMASINGLLSRYTNTRDIILGTPVAGREHSDLENQIGLYLNTLAIRTAFEEDVSFEELLTIQKDTLLKAYSHQDYPFDKLIEELKLNRDISRSALFDVIVVFQNQQELLISEDLTLHGVEVSPYEDIDKSFSKFDISFCFKEVKGQLDLHIEYNTDVYELSFIERLCTHFDNFLTKAIQNPDQKITRIDYLTVAEKSQLLIDFNTTSNDYPNSTIVDLFVSQVEKTPDAVAIVFGEVTLTYKELDIMSNQLAHYLLSNYDLKTEDLIAVKLDRSELLVVSLLAVLKTGCAYVPIDPNYPKQRIKYIEDDSDCVLAINDKLLTDFQDTKGLLQSIPAVAIMPSNLAYVIYTSGSTGKPKGVMIEHKSVLNLCFWHIDNYELDTSSRGSLYAGIGFDASVWEIYPYLVSGGALYPISDSEIRYDVHFLTKFLNDNEITHAYLPTKICEELSLQKMELRNTKILTGGEVLTLSEETHALKIYNNYGPSENTVVATSFDLSDRSDNSIPIGRPIANTEIYILSEGLALQPIRIEGELCISGSGLSRGYLNRSELTAEKFITHPFKTDERMYKTGDLARWSPDGNIEFVGRKDNQVKIRGYRIELGEIEHVISCQSEIEQVVVVAKIIANNTILVAYIVAHKEINKQDLRSIISQELPDYMVPDYYVRLDSIPLTSNGKIDNSLLPEIGREDCIQEALVSPTNKLEEKLVVIWKEVFGVDKISIKDDIFSLGGHSLIVTKLINEYKKVFEVKLNLKDVYEQTTLESHARLIAKSTKLKLKEIEPLKDKDYYDLSPTQLRFWLLYKVKGRSIEFNIHNRVEWTPEVNIKIFQQSLNELIARHEMLRTIFLEKDGIPKQKVLKPTPVQCPVYRLDEIEQAREDIFDKEFNFEVFPLFKIALLETKNGYDILYNQHHIISDGWSMGIIFRDLMTIYNSKIDGKEPEIPKLDIQYKEFAHWQNQIITNESLRKQEDYWTTKLSGNVPYLQLPADYDRTGKNNNTVSGYHTTFLSEELKNKIDAVARENKVSIFSLFVASVNIFLNRLTSENDITVGIPVANRNHYQLKNIVGCFLNTLMLRNQLQKEKSFKDFLNTTHETLMDGLVNQDYPFEHLLEKLGFQSLQSNFPISPIFLNMLDFDLKSDNDIKDFSSIQGEFNTPPKFEIEFYFKSYANSYCINCVYDKGLFTEASIQYWIEEYVSIINQAVDNTSQSIENINVFKKFLYEVKDPVPTNDFQFYEDQEVSQSIVSRFEKQVCKTPEAVAIRMGNTSVTYRALNNNANRVANEIIHNVTKDCRRVALLIDKKDIAVLTMLATLKTGNTYVPIDANYPLNRIKYMLEDSNVDLILCTPDTQQLANDLCSSLPDMKIMTVSSEEEIDDIPNLNIKIEPLAEAYILYTSGSTGKPKGVIQNHRNVLHFIRVYTNNIHISEKDIISLLPTYSFDASVKDIYGALLNGAKISIYNLHEYDALANLSNWLVSEKITILHMVPTVYRYFLKGVSDDTVFEDVRIIDMGGEACYALDFEYFKKHFKKGALFVNDYGPTESTITLQKFLSHDSILNSNNIPLGKPVLNTTVYLLDENDNELGVYQEGEIVYKSDYLSLGYLNKDEQTKKVFKEDPITSDGRVYYSGDIGRLLPNGEIEFLRRKDTQVKLNGLRIELSEIERKLESIDAVSEAVVLLKEFKESQYLTAYIRKRTEIDKTEIRKVLKSELPQFMVPGVYKFIETFPLTPTGKIDKKSLPEIIPENFVKKEYVAPKTYIEKRLVEMWEEVLDIKKVGITDNFFELGGNSLKAMNLIFKIKKEFNAQVNIQQVFVNPTITFLAISVENCIWTSQEKKDLKKIVI